MEKGMKVFYGDRLWMGHRRLAIVDLSEAGHQPMSYDNQRYWITFNGEVYNYIELKEELIELGHRFKSSTDTEVIMAAYVQWGEQCLHRFNGMWAFVILDTLKRKLFVARDRFGVKPVYYSLQSKSLGISSEIKQLLGVGFGNGEADREEVSKFLLYGEVNINRQTLFKDIYQLLPGEALIVDLENDLINMKHDKYYQPPYNRSMHIGGEAEEFSSEFNRLFDDSVRLRMRSDVQVGSCLSGGLDSSSIVMSLSKQLQELEGDSQKPKTFTSCFEDSRFDEWNYAQQIVSEAQTDSHRVFPNMNHLLDEMDEVTWHQEEPFRSSSIYAQWNVMRLANQAGIKVLLDGQGADEVMAGYHYFIPIYLANMLKSLRIGTLLNSIKTMKSTGILEATESSYLTLKKTLYYLVNVKKLRPVPMKQLMKKQYTQIEGRNASSSLQTRLYEGMFGSLQSLLRHEDRNSMAFSIEARTPFLDYRIVELFMRMPGQLKIRNGWTKPFLRESMENRMPDSVRLRTDKKGFVTPEAIWFNENIDIIRKMLVEGNSPIAVWIDIDLLKSYLQQEKINYQLIWRILSLHIWLRRFNLK